MSLHKVFINGEWVASHSKATLDVLNPATGERIAQVSDCDAQDVNNAVAAAKKAQYDWWKTPGVTKAVLLRDIGTRIRAMTKELATQMAIETGKPYCEAHDCIDWTAACYEYYGEYARSSYGNSVPPVAPHQINFTIKEPFGVVAAIVPFNFPLLLMAWKIAPAIAAGNTVVLKAPHQNPLCNLMLAKCYEGILPPGVVNVLTGGGNTTGEALINHEDIDMIAFTGSCAVGRHVAEVAGRNLKKVNLELGSVDPFIVFADADLDIAAQGAAWARLLNAGQVCTSSKRIYVEKAIADKFVEKIHSFVKTLTVGDPMKKDTDVGPVISALALAKVDEQVKKAVEQGARILHGGKIIQPNGLKGFYYAPTILVDVKHGTLPTREEIFGPVISITVAKDADEAIKMANDSKYGLGACIYTNHMGTAMKAMENIKAGTFWINDPLTDNDAAPFGGMRWSGMGRELGAEGLDAFREPKHVHLDWIAEKKSWFFPYKDRH